MDILNRTYTASEVADLTGVTVKNLANWADRGLVPVANEGAVGRGLTREYSWFTLMQTACAAAIMDLGFTSPQEALTAALHFAHIGKGQSGWIGEPASDRAVRHPGLPFHHMRGVTMFYVAGDRSDVLLHRIWNKEPFADGFFKLKERLAGARGHVALNVSEIFEEVCRRLGEDYRLVLDAAYQGHDDAVNWRHPGQED